MYWFNRLIFALYFFLIFIIRGERFSHIMFLVLHLNYIYTLSSFICRFKKHLWKGEIPSWYQVCMLICWQGVNLFHVLSHLVCQILVCNVHRIKKWKLLLPLHFSDQHDTFQIQTMVPISAWIGIEKGYISKWKKLYSFKIIRKFLLNPLKNKICH